MFTIEFTNTERDTLLDLLKTNIMDLTYIKNQPDLFTTELTFKLIELEGLYDLILASEYDYGNGLYEDEDDYVQDYVSRKFTEIDSRLKFLEDKFQDDLK